MTAGVAGVLALGVLGEADRLADAERERVLSLVVEEVEGRVDVIVGVSHPATVVAAARGRVATRAGASAVMLSPPPATGAGTPLREHFRRVADAAGLPVVVQDHPASSGVRLPAEFLAELTEVLPPGSAIKLEDPPTTTKTARVRSLAPGLPVFGGLGGVALLQELQAGAVGTMTGFACPELLVEIVQSHNAGDRAHARGVFARSLPLLVFEAQPGVGLGVRKEILRRRGAIVGANLRAPATELDHQTLESLDELLEAFSAPAEPRASASAPSG